MTRLNLSWPPKHSDNPLLDDRKVVDDCLKSPHRVNTEKLPNDENLCSVSWAFCSLRNVLHHTADIEDPRAHDDSRQCDDSVGVCKESNVMFCRFDLVNSNLRSLIRMSTPTNWTSVRLKTVTEEEVTIKGWLGVSEPKTAVLGTD